MAKRPPCAQNIALPTDDLGTFHRLIIRMGCNCKMESSKCITEKDEYSVFGTTSANCLILKRLTEAGAWVSAVFFRKKEA
jgi:hypothetical protein